MVITTPDGIAMINLQTREIEKIVAGRAHIIMVGRKTGQIYYGTTNRTVFAVDPVTKVTREIVTLPRGRAGGDGQRRRNVAGRHHYRAHGLGNEPGFF